MNTEEQTSLDLGFTEPKIFERLENGLVRGVNYPLRPDGRIQWEKLIPHQHIVFNNKLDVVLKKTYGNVAANLDYGELVSAGTEVDSKHVLVLLMGLIEVADLRGYYSATPRIAHVVHDWAKNDEGRVIPGPNSICTCECVIQWISNREEPAGKASYGTADATMENTGGWGYLSAMAGNRAFCRAVRQGLRIPILAFDEIAKKDTVTIPESGPSPTQQPVHTSTLQKAADAAKLTFDDVKRGAADKYKDKMKGEPAKWNTWSDIPVSDCLQLIKIIRDKLEAGKS